MFPLQFTKTNELGSSSFLMDRSRFASRYIFLRLWNYFNHRGIVSRPTLLSESVLMLDNFKLLYFVYLSFYFCSPRTKFEITESRTFILTWDLSVVIIYPLELIYFIKFFSTLNNLNYSIIFFSKQKSSSFKLVMLRSFDGIS